MMSQHTIEKLHGMRLRGMAEAYRQQMEDAGVAGLSFDERFGMLVDSTVPGGRTKRWRGG